jgi:hypothetical protein
MRVGDITENWIGAYLDWMGADEQAPVQVYAEWGDEASLERGASELEELSAAALLAAVRAESDCVHILRGILDAPAPRLREVKDACRALEHMADDVHAMTSRVLGRRIH